MYDFFFVFSLKNNSKKYFLSKNVINLTFQLLEVVNIQTRDDLSFASAYDTLSSSLRKKY
jgi:hypothetical protein